jgi:hypothetical protein
LLITSGADIPRATMLPAGSIFMAKPYELEHVVTHAKTLTAA